MKCLSHRACTTWATSAEIAKKALKDNITLKESANSLGYLSEQDFDNLVKPEEMVSPKKV